MKFVHSRTQKGYDSSDDSEFNYNISDTLIASIKDNKFRIFGEHSSQLQGTVRTSIELSVDEAKKLREELDRFINKTYY